MLSAKDIRIRAGYAMTVASAYITNITAYADGEGTSGNTVTGGNHWGEYVEEFAVPSHAAATTALGKVLGALIYVSSMFGSVILIWGLVRFYLSFKNEDPEAKQRAIMTTVTGCLLFSLEAVLRDLNVIV